MNKELAMQEDIKFLRDSKLRVSIIHYRRISQTYEVRSPIGKITVDVPVELPLFEIRRLKLTDRIISKGGYTTARIWGNGIDVVAESRCHDEADIFNNKLGSTKAFYKALKLVKEIK